MLFLSCISTLLLFFSECTPGISYNSTFRYGIKQRRWHLTGKYNVLILWSKRDNSNNISTKRLSLLQCCEETKYLLFFFIWHNTGFCYYKASNIDFIHTFVLGIFSLNLWEQMVFKKDCTIHVIIRY
jgi:hypothetical protein